MKNLFSVLMALFLCAAVNGQSLVYESNETMSLGNQPAYVVEIEGADKKISEKMLKEYLKDFGKVERNKKAKEYYAEQIRIPSIQSGNPVNVIAKIEEGKDMTRVFFWIDNGQEFVSSESHATSADGAGIFADDYRIKVRKEVVRKQLEDQEDELKDLEKHLKKLMDKNEDYHNEIEKCNEKIRKAESNIEKNLGDQDEKRMEIEKQKAVVEEIIRKLNDIGRR